VRLLELFVLAELRRLVEVPLRELVFLLDLELDFLEPDFLVFVGMVTSRYGARMRLLTL
jgi:hypothetical protein